MAAFHAGRAELPPPRRLYFAQASACRKVARPEFMRSEVTIMLPTNQPGCRARTSWRIATPAMPLPPITCVSVPCPLMPTLAPRRRRTNGTANRIEAWLLGRKNTSDRVFPSSVASKRYNRRDSTRYQRCRFTVYARKTLADKDLAHLIVQLSSARAGHSRTHKNRLSLSPYRASQHISRWRFWTGNIVPQNRCRRKMVHAKGRHIGPAFNDISEKSSSAH